MPNIPFPHVPSYPGVPALVRPVSAAIASSPVLAIGIGTLENILGSALQQSPRWGIFDSSGNQLGINTSASISRTKAITSALAGQMTGADDPVLSTVGFDFMKEMRLSDFPVEGGHYANYNKVEMPANPVVTLALAATEGYRTNFLNAIDAACKSTGLYSVVTPEVTYFNYSVERYTYQRRAYKGATLLIVDISLKEIRQVEAIYKTVPTPIVNPQNSAATPQVNNGMTQPTAPDTSTLKSLTNKIPALAGAS